jgi:AB1gp56
MKYQGSKNRTASEIIPLMTSHLNKEDYFVDLFCGGCNLIDKVPRDFIRLSNDNNEFLIEMWKALQNGWIGETTIERELYNKARDAYNKRDYSMFTKAELGWIGHMASFNGRFFAGGYSGHNVQGSKGKARDYISESIRNVLNQLPAIKDVVFSCENYDNFILPPADKCVVYCDIPYKGVKQYSTSKTFDYEAFYQWCRERSKDGYKVFVSEYNMPDDFECIWEKPVLCSLNQTITKKPIEKLFTI